MTTDALDGIASDLERARSRDAEAESRKVKNRDLVAAAFPEFLRFVDDIRKRDPKATAKIGFWKAAIGTPERAIEEVKWRTAT